MMMPREVLDGLGSKFDANMEQLPDDGPRKGQDKRVPYGPRRSELEAMAADMKIEDRGQMTRDELAMAIEANTKKPKKGKSK